MNTIEIPLTLICLNFLEISFFVWLKQMSNSKEKIYCWDKLLAWIRWCVIIRESAFKPEWIWLITSAVCMESESLVLKFALLLPLLIFLWFIIIYMILKSSFNILTSTAICLLFSLFLSYHWQTTKPCFSSRDIHLSQTGFPKRLISF